MEIKKKILVQVDDIELFLKNLKYSQRLNKYSN